MPTFHLFFINYRNFKTKKSYSLDKFDIESPTNDIEQAVISFYEAKDNMVTTPIDFDKHFIIAGAFSSEKNAQKMIAKLKVPTLATLK